MATQAELVTQVQAIGTKLAKIEGETRSLLTKIDTVSAALAEAIANANTVTPELQSAVDALNAQAGVVDDLVADPEPPTP